MSNNILGPELSPDADLPALRVAVLRLLAQSRRFVRLGGALVGNVANPILSATAVRLAHSLLQHNDATDATPARGSMVVGTTAGRWTALSLGVAGRLLRTIPGSDPGVEWTRGAVTFGATAPTSGTAVTTSPAAVCRHVFGHYTLTSTVGNAATLKVDIETVTGSGSYTTLRTYTAPAGVVTLAADFWFPVFGGCRYKLTKGGLAGVTETIDDYNYYDL